MAWTLYKEIRYALAGIPSANLTDFDQLVTITTDADIAAELGSGGGIKFTSADGSSDLPFGLYPTSNLAAGTVVALVKCTLLTAASVGDVIARLYYSSSESTTENKSGVAAAYDLFMPLEEDPSGSAPQMRDWSTDTLAGTVHGTASSGDSVTGQVGKALDFSGSYRVQLPDNQLDFGSATDFCISALVKLSSNGTWQAVIDKRHGSGAGWFILIGSSGQVWFYIQGSGTAQKNDWGDTALTDNAWHVLTINIDRDGVATLYIDGALQSGTVTVSSVGNVDNAKVGVIGSISPTSNSLGMTGVIDELTIGPLQSAAWASHYAVNRRSPSSTFTLSAEMGGGGVTTSPASVSVLWTPVAPTLRKTASPSPVTAAWSPVAATLAKSRTVEPVAIQWTAAAPALTKTAAVSPATAQWTAAAPSLRKTTAPDPVALTWSVATPTLSKSLAVAPVQLAWTAATVTTSHDASVIEDALIYDVDVVPALQCRATVEPAIRYTAGLMPAILYRAGVN